MTIRSIKMKLRMRKKLKELKRKVIYAKKNNKNYDYEFHKENLVYKKMLHEYNWNNAQHLWELGLSNYNENVLGKLMQFNINDAEIRGYAIKITLYHLSEYLMDIRFEISDHHDKIWNFGEYTTIKKISLKIFNYKTGEVYCTCSNDFYKEYYENSKNEFNKDIENGVSFNMNKYKNFDKWCLKQYCASSKSFVISGDSPYIFEGVKIDEVRMHIDFDLLSEDGDTYKFSLRNLACRPY